MATYSKQLLSGGSNGKNIKVAATADPGTTIHTAVSGTSSIDEIWLWAFNSDTVDRNLTIEYGSNSSPDDLVVVTIPSKVGWVLVVPGHTLQNSLVVKAYGSAASVIMLNGYVNRIS